MERTRGVALAAVAVLAAAFVACGDGQSEDDAVEDSTTEETASAAGAALQSPPPMPASPTAASSARAAPTSPSAAGVSPTAATAAPASSTPTGSAASVGPSGYNPNLVMWSIFAAPGHPSEATYLALSEARKHTDVSQVSVIIQMARFFSSAGIVSEMVDTLEELTGQRFGGDQPDWGDWIEWYGRNAAQYRPPEQFAEWKANLYTAIHPRLGGFILPDSGPTLIDLTEVVWGGVAPDGIPDIQDPEILTAQEAGFLEPDDRVFGVSINGEHRAYPLRVTNPHEMVNDVLGGEPIALAY